MPIGIEGFEEIRTQEFYYVDKTMFLAELLENWGKVNLFTRPRRFGKSLMMDMMKTFFEIGCDGSLFDGLKISQEKELCEEYMGQFPVISITLKNVDGPNFQAASNALRFVIGNEALRFEFLGESDRLSAAEKESYAQLTKVSDGSEGKAVYDISDASLAASLMLLSQLLSKHYGKKVILLIDEYDVPLDKAFQNGYYDEMVSLIRNVLGSTLKTNPALQFAVLTGCLRISKESIITGLNNFHVMTVTDEGFNDCFGFTEDEVRELLAYYGRGEAIDTMREWYDGYRFGGASVYCPWDVILYAQALRRSKSPFPQNYWANSSGNDLVRSFLNHADHAARGEIERLIAGEAIQKSIRQELTYREIYDSPENLWSVLLATGYLTAAEQISSREYLLRIPNAEIRDLFVTQVTEWFRDTSRADSAKILKFCAAFPEGDAPLIEEMLGDYLWNSISIRDTAIRSSMKENFYHGMLLGLLQNCGSWEIQSNAELGEGYSDIVIRTRERIGVVIEIKYADDGSLEKGCADALKQIEDRKYAEELERDNMRKVIRYGIAFYKKSCRVAKP